MHLSQLTIRQYRNLHAVEVECALGVNLILGANGQGKTNFLDVLYLLSNARSQRSSSDRELIEHQRDFATIDARLYAAGQTNPEHPRHLQAQFSLSAENRLKTVFKQDGLPLKSRSELIGQFPTVSFFLPDLLLLRGSPEDRRRWLDVAATQHDKRHFHLLHQFQKIRQQKSKLLKDAQGESAQTVDLLDVLNQQFAEAAIQLMTSRNQYLYLIQDVIERHWMEINQGCEALSVCYQTQSPIEALQDTLTAKKHEELKRGLCLVGPHRDDLQIELNQTDARLYASQGQQRAIVLALKLSELELLTIQHQLPPVLLLDDVMAELDPQKQHALIEQISVGGQVFLTTTHLDQTLHPQILAASSNQRLFRVEEGAVFPETQMVGCH